MIVDGQLLADAAFLRRCPLNDCTNIVVKEMGEEITVQTLKTKGHWKRQVRLKGKGDTRMNVDLPETRTEHGMKRNKPGEDQQQEAKPG